MCEWGLKRIKVSPDFVTYTGVYTFLHEGMSFVAFQRTTGCTDPWEFLVDGHVFHLIMIIMVLYRVSQLCFWCYVSLKQSGSAPTDPKMICYDDKTFLSHDPAV